MGVTVVFDRPSVFICHVREQKDVAERIFHKLADSGIEILFDRGQLKDGERPDGDLKGLVERADLFVFLLTNESLDPTRYVHTEVAWRRDAQPIVRKDNLLVAQWQDLDRSRHPIEPYLDVLVKLEVKGDYAAHIAQAIVDRFEGRKASPLLKGFAVLWTWRYRIAMALVALLIAAALAVPYLVVEPTVTLQTGTAEPVLPGVAVESGRVFAKVGNREGQVWTERLISVLGEDDSTMVHRGDWIVFNEWVKLRADAPEQTDRGLVHAREVGRVSPGTVVQVKSIESAPLISGVEHFWFSFDRRADRLPLHEIGHESSELIVPKRDLVRERTLRVAAFARVSARSKGDFAVLGVTLERVNPDGTIESIAVHELTPVAPSPRFATNQTMPRPDQQDFSIAFDASVVIGSGVDQSFRVRLIQDMQTEGERRTGFPLSVKLDASQTELVVDGEYVLPDYMGSIDKLWAPPQQDTRA